MTRDEAFKELHRLSEKKFANLAGPQQLAAYEELNAHFRKMEDAGFIPRTEKQIRQQERSVA